MTDRYRLTLELVCAGLTNGEIACSLGVSEEAIKSRMKVLKNRYGARTRAHLVALAIRAGDVR